MLKVNGLIGFGGRTRVKTAIAHQSVYTSESDLSEYSSSMNFGAVSPHRWIYTAFGGFRNGGSSGEAWASGVTIGGVAAERVDRFEYENSPFWNTFEIWRAKVPTGTSGTVTWTYSATVSNICGCTTRVVHGTGVPQAANTNTTSDNTYAETTPAATNGLGLAYAFTSEFGTASSENITWTNASEDFDQVFGSNFVVLSGATFTPSGSAVRSDGTGDLNILAAYTFVDVPAQ